MKVVVVTVIALGVLYYLAQQQPAQVADSPFGFVPDQGGARGTYRYALDVNGSTHAYIQVPGSPGLIMVSF